MNIIQAEEKKSSIWFQAKTVTNQFSALSHYVCNCKLREEIIAVPYFVNKLSVSRSADRKKVESLLMNSRNTEYILRSNIQKLEHKDRACFLQCAFPQAYYSVFNSLRALYHTLGYSEADKSHSHILKKFALMVLEGKLPNSVSFYSDGGKRDISYKNIVKPTGLKPMSFSALNEDTIRNQICQFLKSTREQKLNSRKERYCLEYKKKFQLEKHVLTQSEWKEISSQIGPTTIMDFLYRKRIKSNYEDVDSFISEEFEDGPLVLRCICDIVYQLNYIIESYICKAVGRDEFITMIGSKHKLYDFANRRLITILDL